MLQVCLSAAAATGEWETPAATLIGVCVQAAKLEALKVRLLCGWFVCCQPLLSAVCLLSLHVHTLPHCWLVAFESGTYNAMWPAHAAVFAIDLHMLCMFLPER